MSEILSIGKSIKIIRYLDKVNIVKDGFDDFADFKNFYLQKMKTELLITKENDSKDLLYMDEDNCEPNKKLIECAKTNLNNIWEPNYEIRNVMCEN